MGMDGLNDSLCVERTTNCPMEDENDNHFRAREGRLFSIRISEGGHFEPAVEQGASYCVSQRTLHYCQSITRIELLSS